MFEKKAKKPLLRVDLLDEVAPKETPTSPGRAIRLDAGNVAICHVCGSEHSGTCVTCGTVHS